MQRKIYTTGRSGNDNHSNIRYQNNDLNYEFRIFDTTGIAKRLFIITKNIVVSAADNELQAWKTYYFKQNDNSPRYFNFSGEIIIKASGLNGIEATTGNKYRVNSNETGLEYMEAASSPSEIQFYNNSANTLYVTLTKGNGKIETSNVNAGSTKAWRLKPTFWIHAIEDLTTPIVIGNIIGDINTEISVFGVKTADILIAKSNPMSPYQYSLDNITYL